jgi:dienelactone hydrolase
MRMRAASLAVLAIIAIGVLIFASCAGLRCSLTAHRTHKHQDDAITPEKAGWETLTPIDGMTVYAKGDTANPPILLLHEIPGLIPETVHFADQLVEEHKYRVYMPLFFGKFGNPPVGRLRQLLVCAGPNFNCYTTRPSPVIGKLEHLRDYILSRHPRQQMGIIGMCLTGGMPVALVNDRVKDRVAAIVLSQPALPLPLTASMRRSLGVDPKPALDSKVAILGVHFGKDCLAPPERFQSLAGQLELRTIPTTDPHAHSVLTVEGQHSKDKEVGAAIKRVFDFLDEHLRR